MGRAVDFQPAALRDTLVYLCELLDGFGFEGSTTAEALAEAAVRAVGGDIMWRISSATDGTVVVADVNGTPDLALYKEEPSPMCAIACAIARRHEREGRRSAHDPQRVPPVR